MEAPSGQQGYAEAGLERSRLSSTAVANITESAARSFLNREVEQLSARMWPNSLRMSADSTTVSFQPFRRDSAPYLRSL